jgi:phage/plasmid-like protein (TIGR03299 family)
MRKVEDYYSITRSDTGRTLGVVKGWYEPCQNDEMFDFMDKFLKAAGTRIETCGSLRNGRTVWALAKAGTVEFLPGDPVDEYFLFRNGFDGRTNIELCFTTIRVVCNNTLSAALEGAANLWKIRHTRSRNARLEEVYQAIEAQNKNSLALKEAMVTLLNKKMGDREVLDFFTRLVTPPAKGDMPTELKTSQANVINKMAEIYFGNGLGMDLKGVRGSAYGALQSVTAWADHYRTIRPGERDKAEARFESNFMGSAAAFKADAFNLLMAA